MRTTIALIVAMAGVIVMLLGSSRGGAGAGGAVCGAISGVAFGALILTLESVNRRADGAPVNPFLVVTINNLGTAIVVLPVTIWLGHVGAPAGKIGLMGLTGIVQLAVPYVLFVVALRRVEPVDASLLILLEPVLNPIWVWLAVGERPDLATFIGGGAILVAMLIDATKQMKPERA
jgi:drug/metabolite transporter (DMT)-like permease